MDNTSTDPHDSLPLTEATFFILLSMARTQRHGYAILKDVADLSDARIRLSTGTLYGALNRLLDQGWVERLDSEEPSGRPRKEYALTDLGRRILAAETHRLESLVALARRRLIEDKP
jgi:DNA-binding PadR family transcriptional regulator